MYDSNEAVQMAYEDEGDEPISLTELENLYNNIGTIKFNGKNYRTDIGKLNIYKGY